MATATRSQTARTMIAQCFDIAPVYARRAERPSGPDTSLGYRERRNGRHRDSMTD